MKSTPYFLQHSQFTRIEHSECNYFLSFNPLPYSANRIYQLIDFNTESQLATGKTISVHVKSIYLFPVPSTNITAFIINIEPVTINSLDVGTCQVIDL